MLDSAVHGDGRRKTSDGDQPCSWTRMSWLGSCIRVSGPFMAPALVAWCAAGEMSIIEGACFRHCIRPTGTDLFLIGDKSRCVSSIVDYPASELVSTRVCMMISVLQTWWPRKGAQPPWPEQDVSLQATPCCHVRYLIFDGCCCLPSCARVVEETSQQGSGEVKRNGPARSLKCKSFGAASGLATRILTRKVREAPLT